MSPTQIIQSLFNTDSIQKASIGSLKPGQVLFGRLENFLSKDTAIVQIGNTSVVAHVKASLLTKDSYWFEVVSNNEKGIQLKVFERNGNNDSNNLLAEHFQLPGTKLNQQLLEFLLSKNFLFTKEQLRVAVSWISNPIEPKELDAIECMFKKDLPFTNQTFQSLIATDNFETLSQQLEKTNNLLDDPNFNTLKTIQPLKQLISDIIKDRSVDEVTVGKEVKQMLRVIVRSLGLEYESEVELWAKNKQNSIEFDTLKPLLMEAMSELGTSSKVLEPLLHRITGMQLISQDLTGPMQQMMMQLPLSIGGKKSDVTFQWSGRKKDNGQIDPDYCRILFYLDLKSLDQTVIDMQIQNKVIHVSVLNNSDGLEPIVVSLIPTLKEKLESIGYKLSFIKVVPFLERNLNEKGQMNPSCFSKKHYQKVDIKI